MGLFKPAWQSDKLGKAEKAVKKMTDQSELERVVKESHHKSLRLSAMENITDQTILSRIAIDDGRNHHTDIRKKAIAKLTDQDVLARIVTNDIDPDIRVGAIRKISRQDVLVSIIKNERGGYQSGLMDTLVDLLRERITEQASLIDVAENAKIVRIRFEAAKRLDDEAIAQELFRALANASDYDVCMEAAALLSDKVFAQTTYARIANNATKDAHRNQLPTAEMISADRGVKAVEQITDQELLSEIALGPATARVRNAAIEKTTDIDTLRLIADDENPERYRFDLGFGVTFDLFHTAQERLDELQEEGNQRKRDVM